MALLGANIGVLQLLRSVFTHPQTEKSPIFGLKWAHIFSLFPSILFCQEIGKTEIIANMQLKRVYFERNFNTLKIFDFWSAKYVVIVYFCQENGSACVSES